MEKKAATYFSETTLDPQRSRELTDNCHWQSCFSRPQTFCFINQKGGVGKSSTCFHLAGAFADMRFRVLVMDVDPQGSISQGFFGSATVEELAASETVTSVFADTWTTGDAAQLRPTRFERIDVCPANLELADYNTPRPETLGLDQFALREFIDSQTGYDIVLIDCPPNLYRCSWSAMIAADWVVIPVTPEDFGTQGLRAVHQAIENARALNPNLRRLGHLVTRSDGRMLVHKAYERRLRTKYGNLVLDTLMPELSAFKLALAARTPVVLHDQRCRATDLTQELAREILERATVRQARRQVA
ncbi:MAG: ParA family protein [Planctomycetales bacterium]|nr:ParA family protein [Planctomycetales bacterium]